MWCHSRIQRPSWILLHQRSGKTSTAWNDQRRDLAGLHQSQNTGHQGAQWPLQIWRQKVWRIHHHTLAQRALLGVGCYGARHFCCILRAFNIAKRRCGSGKAARNKESKYAAISQSHHFVPVAVETSGSWHADSLSFVQELGGRIFAATGDQRETSHLLQRLSVALQIGNSLSGLATADCSNSSPGLNDGYI